MLWRVGLILVLGLCVGCASWPVVGGKARILKVLPHYVDQDGRHSQGPGLLDRDIYQQELRGRPEDVKALRFDVKWVGRGLDPKQTKLRIELRSSKAGVEGVTLEEKARPRRMFSSWTTVAMAADIYAAFGVMESWRVTLWEGDRLVSEQKSFLW
ncbi:MAG: hypothetical protein VX705_01515 [Verrucomicrobiota bacterium]|nr:hypothetical protein [Verrucomicrobiota bacterium]